MQLKDKTAFITGGASGLGRATAENFIKAGANVVLFDLNEENAEKTASELGAQATYAAGDVADEAAVTAAIEKGLSAFGAIHVNVNSAGIGAAARTIGRDGPMPLKTFEFIVRVNLIGTFNCLRLCADAMQKNEPLTDDGERGVIVNVASVAAYDGQIGQAAYSASKGGIVGMTLPLSRDLAATGIRVMTVAPGLIDTPIYDTMPEGLKERLASTPVFPKRLGLPDEYAHLVQAILENRYLNGETIRLDAALRMAPK